MLVLNPEVPFALAGWACLPVRFSAFPPRVQRRKKGLYRCIGCMGMQQWRRAPAHEVLRLEPEAMLANHTPEGYDGLAVEFPTGMGQCIQLLCLADGNPPHP